ncbi:hypothetical protein H2O64_15905 [Kordia sp. YSTF-M3]|uniref:YhhN-like protein n=1 Tax=Kordia aestuariivivens TaxID=2759037 RepID=A0ABR7QC52_9FLAO|nr:lysoplasmalogenase family protein [Kordia aestuariivivens]MBC8756161.1 hypothetical protein [Kordia aestuariivivens]
MPTRKLLTYLYFIIMLFDAFAVFFPDIINRRYTTYFPLPILMLLYLLSVKKINWFYVIGLVCTFLGVVFFSKQFYFKLGLVFYAVGVLFYVLICLKQAAIISVKSVIVATIPFLIIYLVPLILYADAVQVDIFNYIILYVFFVGSFFFISSLIYFNQRNNRNLWLFSSGILFVISTTIHGYNMFFGYVKIVQFFVIITFILMHYAMYRYIIHK